MRKKQKIRLAALLAASLVATLAMPAAADTPPDDAVPVFEELTFEVDAEVRVVPWEGAVGGGETAAAGTTCKEIHAWVTARTLLGLVAYTYNHEVGWCYDGDTITEIEGRRDWATDVDDTYEWVGTHDDYDRYYRWGGHARGRYKSYYQGHFRQCIYRDWGCRNFYPWIEINVYADGDSDYDGDEG